MAVGAVAAARGAMAGVVGRAAATVVVVRAVV
jgi:hypothetical protein